MYTVIHGTVETLIPRPKRPYIPYSHLRDKYNF